jgi:hypothetical protein
VAPSGEAEDVRAAAAAIRAELRKLRASLARIEETVDSLPGRERRRGRPGERSRPERYYRVLVGVYERGGRHGITAEELGAVGGEHGYDRRGLGGFFAGAQAPLRLAEGHARLTPEGLRLVDRYLGEVTR